MNRFVTFAGLAVLMAVAPRPAAAQTLLLDEGTFVIRSEGRDIGQETFTIRRSGTDASSVVTAQGRVTLTSAGDIRTSLETAGPALRPAAYQIAIEGDAPQRIAGRVAGGRFSARIVSPEGEMMREYLAGDGAVIIDDGVAHQHYFIARRIDEAPFTIPVIIPRQSRQASASVSAPVTERVSIAGQSVSARRFSVELTGGDARTVWIDGAGRVLRLEVPAQGLTVERTALPD